MEYENLRKQHLESLKLKQPFRVATGKSQWIDYTNFKKEYNLREILNDEIVIEFDSEDLEVVVKAISQTGLNLYNAGYTFEYWDHGGKSPHLHIHDLPFKNLSASDRSSFKKIFIKKYVPLEYLHLVDISLTGIHLIALEWAEHWKGKYSIKKLIWIHENGEFKT